MGFALSKGYERPHFTIDREVDAAYLDLAPDSKEARLKQVILDDHPFEADIILDVDSQGKIIGIEVLGASIVLNEEILKLAEGIG